MFRYAVAFAAVVLVCACGVQAELRTWEGDVSNWWSAGGNWSPFGEPGAGDDVFVFAGTDLNTVYFNPSGGATAQLGSVLIGSTNGQTATLLMYYNSTLNADYTGVGCNGTGVVLQSSGTTQSSLAIGLWGGYGYYHLVDGSVAGQEILIGVDYGAGSFEQSTGQVQVGERLSIGSDYGSMGMYYLNGGTLTASNLLVGEAGYGAFNHNSGTCVANELSIGLWSSSAGGYSLNPGGYLQAGVLTVGYESTSESTFMMVGGTAVVSDVTYVGRNPYSNGVLNMMGGSFTAEGGAIVGWLGSGTFVHTGGTFKTLELALGVGNFDYVGRGAYEASGNASLSADNLLVGYMGWGYLDLSGSATLTTTYFTSGADSFGHARITINDEAQLNFVDGAMANDSSLVMWGGKVTIGAGGRLDVGNMWPYYTTSLEMYGGVLQGTSAILRVAENCYVSQFGDSAVVVGTLVVGRAESWNSAYYTINDASTLTVVNDLVIGASSEGYYYTYPAFSQNGGSVFAGRAIVGENPLVCAYAYLYGGDFITQGDFMVAGAGEAWVHHEGAYVETNRLIVGNSQSGDGHYTLQNGTLFVYTDEIIGQGGRGYFYHWGGDHYVLGTLRIGQPDGESEYHITDGYLLASTSENYGWFAMSGGTVSSWFVNFGGLHYLGGTFDGVLVQNGDFYRERTFTAEGGFINNSGLWINEGLSVYANGLGFENNAYVGISGPTSELGGSGPIVNRGTIDLQEGGRIAGDGGFVNEGNLFVRGLGYLANSGTNINYGSINMTQWDGGPGTLMLNSTLTNNGDISMWQSVINGSGTLINEGTVRGNGSILCNFVNDGGTLDIDEGLMYLAKATTNTGVISIDWGTLSGGQLTNLGLIAGGGTISNNLTNAPGGRIEVYDDQLTLSGTVTNQAGAIIAVREGRVIVTRGLAVNAGLIEVEEGQFDNNNKPLNNTGTIAGYGSIRTGGLTNNGTIVFGGQYEISSVSGPVTNNTGKQVRVAYSEVMFTGTVVNYGTFKNTGGHLTFVGAYVSGSGGTIISDPADNYFMDTYLMGGSWVGGVGDMFYVKGALNWSAGSMTGTGGQTFSQSGATFSGDAAKDLSGWTFHNQTPAILTGNGNLNMGNGAVFNNTSTLDIQSAADFTNTLGGAATLVNAGTLLKSGPGVSSIASSITLACTGGVVEVRSGELVLDGHFTGALTKAGPGPMSITSANTNASPVVVQGGVLSLENEQTLGNLTIEDGARVVLENAGTLVTGLDLAGGAAPQAQIDLRGGCFVIDYSGESSHDLVAAQIGAGMNGGGWDGLGIMDSSIIDFISESLMLVDNATFMGGAFDVFGNRHVDDTSLLIRKTLAGDVDMSGEVNAADYFYLDFNLGSALWGSANGDLDYSGEVNAADYFFIDFNLGASQGVGSGMSIPEPLTLALLGLGSVAILRRNRR
jgi:hypothetical protein